MSNSTQSSDIIKIKEINYTPTDKQEASDRSHTLADLCNKRETWENTLLTQSNECLYEILSGCYEIFLDIITKNKQRAMLDNYLVKNGVGIQSNTPLATKIIRYVFNNGRKRAHTYSAVLRRAKKDNVTAAGLGEWIKAQGGVEEVRLSEPKETPAAKKERLSNYRINAATLVSSDMSIGSVSPKSAKSIPQSDESNLVLFVGKRAADGSIQIVCDVPDESQSLTNKALEALGKKIEDTGDTAKLEQERVEAQNELENTLAKAAKAVTSGVVESATDAEPQSEAVVEAAATPNEAPVVEVQDEDDVEIDMDALAKIVTDKLHAIGNHNSSTQNIA